MSLCFSEAMEQQRLSETPEKKFDRLTDEKRDLLYEIHNSYGYSQRAAQYKRLSQIEEELGTLMPVLESIDAVPA